MKIELASFAALVILVIGGACALYMLYVLLRPNDASDVRYSDALREFEPRGGRPRFQLRLFEMMALVSMWLSCSTIFIYWATSQDLSAKTQAFLGIFTLSLFLSTWWTWRRGAFRLLANTTYQKGPAAPSNHQKSETLER
jgi:hypothetical protein